MSLEDSLVSKLIELYKSKGVNTQKVLDNPLFTGLPLDKKIQFLEEEAPNMPEPVQSNNKLLSHLGYGLVGGIGAASAARALGPSTPTSLALTVAIPTIMSTVLPYLAVRKDFKRDMATHQDLQANRIYSAILNRSTSSAPPMPGFPLGSVLNDGTKKMLDAVKEFNKSQLASRE